MISLKKYLDMDPDKPQVSQPDPGELLSATLESYSSTLLAVAKNGVRACPALGSDLAWRNGKQAKPLCRSRSVPTHPCTTAKNCPGTARTR